MIYRKFRLTKEAYRGLSKDDKDLLGALEIIVRDFSKVYAVQLGDGFYPKDLTREEVDKAAIDDPSLLSPFTNISRTNGVLKAQPYHQKYAHMLVPIAKKIEQASKFTSNKSFRNYLKARAVSLVDGSYSKADIAWFKVKSTRIDFNIGPFERYLDKLFFIKRLYQAHVGIIDKETTSLAEEIKETLYSFAKVSSNKYHSVEIPKKGVSVIVEQTPATSGYIAEAVFSGEHFPCDLNLMQQCGSKILIYKTQLEYKFDRVHYPIFKTIFEKRFASKYSKEMLLRATLLGILLYELGRQLHKFEGARDRLKELYGIIDEGNGFASGIQHAKQLVVKGVISQDELEAVIIMHIVWMFSDWVSYQRGGRADSWVMGNAILLDYYLTQGALRELNGISWPNFSKIFFSIENLADILVGLLQSGTYSQAQKFIEKHAELENFKRLGVALNKLKFDF